MKSISFGVSLNNRGAVYLSNYSINDILRMARESEKLSFDSVWVGDSLIDSPRYEPLTLLGAVAASSSHIKLGASIIQPHFRNPIMLALSWATLDQLAGGRTILTLGIGGGTVKGVAKEAELSGLSQPGKRGRALEENVEILRRLWSGDLLNYQGQVYKFSGTKLGYFPVQARPPIWVAAGVYIPKSQVETVSATPGYTKEGEGSFAGAFERVAKLADGWFTIMALPEEFSKASDKISKLATRHGRDPRGIRRAIECWININPDKDKAKMELTAMIEGYFGNPVDPETVDRWSIYGGASACMKRIEEYRAAGADTIKFVMGSPDQIAMLKLVGSTVLPSF